MQTDQRLTLPSFQQNVPNNNDQQPNWSVPSKAIPAASRISRQQWTGITPSMVLDSYEGNRNIESSIDFESAPPTSSSSTAVYPDEQRQSSDIAGDLGSRIEPGDNIESDRGVELNRAARPEAGTGQAQQSTDVATNNQPLLKPYQPNQLW